MCRQEPNHHVSEHNGLRTNYTSLSSQKEARSKAGRGNLQGKQKQEKLTFWYAVEHNYVSKIGFPIHAVNIGGNSVLDLQPAAYNSV